MRRAIAFLIASALCAGGLYVLYLQFFESTDPIPIMFILMSAGMVFAGGAWLVGDFILPMLGKKDSE